MVTLNMNAPSSDRACLENACRDSTAEKARDKFRSPIIEGASNR